MSQGKSKTEQNNFLSSTGRGEKQKLAMTEWRPRSQRASSQENQMTQLEKYQSRLWLLKMVTDLILSMFVLPPPISPHFMLKQKPFLQGRAMCLHSKNEKIKQQRGSFLSSQNGKVLNSGTFLVLPSLFWGRYIGINFFNKAITLSIKIISQVLSQKKEKSDHLCYMRFSLQVCSKRIQNTSLLNLNSKPMAIWFLDAC